MRLSEEPDLLDLCGWPDPVRCGTYLIYIVGDKNVEVWCGYHIKGDMHQRINAVIVRYDT